MKAKELAAKYQPSTDLNWKYALFSIGGIVLGVLGNAYVRKQQEKDIIDALTAKIDSLKTTSTTKQLTDSEQKQLTTLKAQHELMTRLKSGRG